MKQIFVTCFVLAIIASVAYSLTGAVCSRTISHVHHRRYCKFWFLGCWAWGSRVYWSYTRIEYCCSGYKPSNGRCVPDCPRGCGGVGRCVAPSVCDCGSTHTGANCGQPQCSYRFPCYPGICSLPDHCECAASFGKRPGEKRKCNEITQRPSVMTANASLEYYDADRKDIIYSVAVVAPDNGTNTLTWWSNIGKFNRFDIAMEAFLDLGELPRKPDYVRYDKFGIKQAQIVYTLTKASSSIPNATETVICQRASQEPESGVVSCNKYVPYFGYRLDNGDVFTMRFEVQSGGYMRLSDGTRTTFIGKSGAKEIRMMFDFIPPYHCRDDNTCGTVREKPPLRVMNDITRDPVILRWSGWGDMLSGLDSYVLEVFKLSGGGVFLLEKDPMKPTFVKEFNTGVDEHIFTPNEPGMYSAILGVKDRANNTRYVRELFLYDNTSAISFDPSQPLHIASASQESNYHWQVPNINGKTPIEVDWTGHFINKVHQEGGFLANVRDYPPQLKNKYLDTVEKAVSTKLKNPLARRKSERIPNANGIVRFQLNLENFLKGVTPIPPMANWREMNVSEKATVDESVSRGDCVLAWVRAFDIINNNATDYGVVCFDDSPPVITVNNFERDFEEISSRIHLRTLDRDSGIAMVKWSFRDNVTQETIELPDDKSTAATRQTVDNTQEECDKSGDCYCINSGECYPESYQLDLDHCLLYQAGIENTETNYIMTLTAFNQAMQNRSTEYLIENVQNLNGMDFCARNIRVVQSEALTAGGISGVAISALLVLVLLILVIFLAKTGRLHKVRERSQEGIRSIRRSIRKGHDMDGLASYKTGGFDEDDIYMYGHQTYEHAPDWIIRPEDLTINNLILIGKFAKIYEASLLQSGHQMKVVAKTLKSDFTEDDSVLMSAKINFFGTKVGRHSCILEMIGAILDDEKMGPVMVLERCGYGSVKDWLTSNKDRPSDTSIDFLFRFVYSIVQGMEYLASREIVHMRLAARNVLLTDKLEPKIAGFGPRHGDDEEDGEKKERIPVKWIAPECLRNNKAATEKSDVWSNGVVMWEIFSFGDTPYPNIRSADLPGALKKGERLRQPEFCDTTHYDIMTKSWNRKPSQRPTFREVREQIENEFHTSGDVNYYDSNFADK